MVKLTIIVDKRESGSIVPAKLEELKLPLQYELLECGDYVVESVVIERKDVSDYLSSLVSGRLNNQLYQMSLNYKRAILLVEGFVDEVLWARKIKRNAYVSSLAGAVCKTAPDGEQGAISVVMVSTPYDSALFMYYLHEKIITGEYRRPSFSTVRKKRTSPALALFLSLPGIGEEKAMRLIERFKSFGSLAGASIDEIDAVEGIGKNLAERIYEAIHSECVLQNVSEGLDEGKDDE